MSTDDAESKSTPRPEGRCMSCRYPLPAGSTYCPECGAEGSYTTDASPRWLRRIRRASLLVPLCCIAAAILLWLAISRLLKVQQVASRYAWWDFSATAAQWLLFLSIAVAAFALGATFFLRRGISMSDRSGKRARWIVASSLILAAAMLLSGVVTYPLRDRVRQPLFEAIRLGDVEKARLCLARGADPNEWFSKSPRPGARPRGMGPIGVPPLFTALHRRQDEIVLVLLDAGADADYRAGDNYTLLMEAAPYAEPRTVAALIEHGADATAVWYTMSSPATRPRYEYEHAPGAITALSIARWRATIARRRATYDEAGAEIVRILEEHLAASKGK